MEPVEFSKRCTGVQGPFFLCLHPQGCLRRSVRALGSFNSGPGNGVFPHVATPTSLRLQFPRETGLILRCNGKIGNPFQTKQENRHSCCNQEGRRGSNDVVWGHGCSPRVKHVCWGTLGVPSWVPSTVLHFSGNVGLLLRCCGGQGAHAAKTMEPRGFS